MLDSFFILLTQLHYSCVVEVSDLNDSEEDVEETTSKKKPATNARGKKASITPADSTVLKKEEPGDSG